jgi:diacylglycerol kinase
MTSLSVRVCRVTTEILYAFCYSCRAFSWKGFRAAWVNEAAFRQEGVAAIVAVAIACWLDVLAIKKNLLM